MSDKTKPTVDEMYAKLTPEERKRILKILREWRKKEGRKAIAV